MIKFTIQLFLVLFCSITSANTVTLILSSGPGGVADQTARHMEKYFLEKKNIKLVVVFKPGADGLIGLRELSRSQNDGTVIGLSGVYTLANIVKNNDLSFEYVTATYWITAALVASSKTSITNYDDFVSKIKSGNKYSFGYNAPSQLYNINQLLRNVTPNHDVITVPYKSSGAVVNDILGGQIDFILVPYPLLEKHIESGTLNLIATADKISGVKNVPSLDNKFKNWIDFTGICFVLPVGTPKHIVDEWNKNLRDYHNDSDTKKFYKDRHANYYQFGAENLKNMIGAINATQ